MKVEGIDDFDLKGVLFARYPLELSWDEALERLELELFEARDYYFPAGDDFIVDDSDVVVEPIINPFWIQLLNSYTAHLEVEMMSVRERRRALKEAKEARAKRWAKKRAVNALAS